MISLSSCESELHSMVSGCCDAIYIRRCLEFLVGQAVEQWQFTDNSAARQLASRQGVGRIRHLSGKLLWVQDVVMEQGVKLCQVPAQWNFSDIGTKSLQKERMSLLLCGIGAVYVCNGEVVGQAEWNQAEERNVSSNKLRRVMKAILFMSGPEPIRANGFCNVLS